MNRYHNSIFERKYSIYTVNMPEKDKFCKSVLNPRKSIALSLLTNQNQNQNRCVALIGQTKYRHSYDWSTDTKCNRFSQILIVRCCCEEI